MHETVIRSIVKSITFRAIILVSDFTVIYLFTKSVSLALGAILVSNLSGTFIYFAHERIWNLVHWGRNHKQSLPVDKSSLKPKII